MELVAIDIGGTHARFALAKLREDGISLGAETVLQTGDYTGLGDAWRAFGESIGCALPQAAAVAVAAPVNGDSVKLTNNAWVIRPSQLAAELGVAHAILVNDFAAVAHAVPVCGAAHLRHLRGPDVPLPERGVISIVGPGTGLGVAMLVRGPNGDQVIATEGGHTGFAPADEVEDRILASLRRRFGRVSVERVTCGAGLAAIYEAVNGRPCDADDRMLWQRALGGEDAAAARALDRYCGILGAAAGDFALAQGAEGVVIAGGLGLRLADRLPGSSFAARFAAKGRFEAQMAGMPVKLNTYPQPGLLGAAAAFMASLRV